MGFDFQTLKLEKAAQKVKERVAGMSALVSSLSWLALRIPGVL
jgi:hypothetical protein